MSENESRTWLERKVELVKVGSLSENLRKKHLAWFIYISSFTANILLITCGCVVAWPFQVIPKLKSNDTEVNPLGAPITTEQVTIITAIPYVALISTSLFMANILETIGRKKMMMYSAASIMFSLNAVAFAKNIFIYYIFLSIIGANMSGILVSVPIYTAEIADINNRCKLGCFVGLTIPCVLLIIYIIGPLSSVKIFTIICALPALLHFLLTHTLIVESPIYLASKRKKLEALKALQRLRTGRSAREIEIEYVTIERTVGDKKRTARQLFCNKAVLTAFLLSTAICVGQQMTGIVVILAFLTPIFNEAGSTLSGNAVGVLVGSMTFLVYLIAAYVVEKVGRKLLLLFSLLFCSVSLFLVATCFYLKYSVSSFVEIENIPWLPGLCVIVFIIVYSMGMGPIPITLIPELFPNELRAFCVALIVAIDCTAMCLLYYDIFTLSNVHATYGVMFGHGISAMVLFLILCFLLPETRGKSLKEIQDVLNK